MPGMSVHENLSERVRNMLMKIMKLQWNESYFHIIFIRSYFYNI